MGRRNCGVNVLVGVVLILTSTCLNAEPVEHVIHISVDGLHAGELQSLMDAQPEDFANFRRFRSEGVGTFNARNDFTNPFTIPNHATMMTGRPVTAVGSNLTLHHGYRNNGTPAATATLHNAGNPNVDYVASVFDIAHDRGLSTALFASKTKFSIFQQSYVSTESTDGGRPDQFLDDGDQGVNKISRFVRSSGETSVALMDVFIPDMEEQLHQYAFLHLLEPDASGHGSGWRSPAWIDSVALVDDHLGRVFELVEQNDDLRDKTAIILTSDHGGAGFFHDADHHTLDVRRVPFFVWGPNIAPGELYERNRFTRQDPLESIPDYLQPVQPIRNGDSPNLALSLLGLPPIDGSSINAQQNLLVELPATAIWNGTDSSAGEPGDGLRWTDPKNWTRNADLDRSFKIADAVSFGSGSRTNRVDVEGAQVVESLRFDADFELTNGSFFLARGAIHVEDGVQATLDVDVRSDRTVVKTGTGHLILNGTTSALFVDSGKLSGAFSVSGELHNNGTLSPGVGIGSIHVERFFDHRHSAVLQMEIAGDDAGLTYDQITSDSDLFLRGNLSIVPIEGYADPDEPGTVDRFDLFSGASIPATFNSFNYDGERLNGRAQGVVGDRIQQRYHVGDGLFRILEFNTTDFSMLNYRATPGDANGDGAFNSADLVAVFDAGNFEDGDNDNSNWLTGDWNGDLDFGTDDLVAAFQAGRYNEESVLLPPNVVPEPNGTWAGAIGIVFLMGFRRR